MSPPSRASPRDTPRTARSRGSGRHSQYLILRSNTLRGVSSVDGVVHQLARDQCRTCAGSACMPDMRDDRALS